MHNAISGFETTKGLAMKSWIVIVFKYFAFAVDSHGERTLKRVQRQYHPLSEKGMERRTG
jgi:hypothetical protein